MPDTPKKITPERRRRRPKIVYPPDLPILSKREEIVAAIRKSPAVVITGETGSGKTTQIPKMCLEAGRGQKGLIGCTQPRRIAATTVARRIAEEMGEEVGLSVGYKIRFDDTTPRDACLKVMTDGILLMEAQRDPWLRAYDTIIVDEAHERSLNIDFILGILKTLLAKRRDLRVVITSATIDTEKFSQAFGGAPIIEVSGRLFPVEVRYRPLDPKLEEKDGITHVDAAVRAVDELVERRERGDILIFMPTEQDIREACELLTAGSGRGPPSYPCSRASPRGSSSGSSSPWGSGRSSSPRTSPRPPSRSPGSATSSTRAWPGSPGTTPARGPRAFPWSPSQRAAPTSARVAAAGSRTGSASGSTRRRTTWAAPSTRRRRSFGPTWPGSSSG